MNQGKKRSCRQRIGRKKTKTASSRKKLLYHKGKKKGITARRTGTQNRDAPLAGEKIFFSARGCVIQQKTGTEKGEKKRGTGVEPGPRRIRGRAEKDSSTSTGNFLTIIEKKEGKKPTSKGEKSWPRVEATSILFRDFKI